MVASVPHHSFASQRVCPEGGLVVPPASKFGLTRNSPDFARVLFVIWEQICFRRSVCPGRSLFLDTKHKTQVKPSDTKALGGESGLGSPHTVMWRLDKTAAAKDGAQEQQRDPFSNCEWLPREDTKHFALPRSRQQTCCGLSVCKCLRVSART